MMRAKMVLMLVCLSACDSTAPVKPTNVVYIPKAPDDVIHVHGNPGETCYIDGTPVYIDAAGVGWIVVESTEYPMDLIMTCDEEVTRLHVFIPGDA